MLISLCSTIKKLHYRGGMELGTKVKRALGSRVYEIAERLKIPKVTVESVIREYIRSLEVSAISGEDIVIDNIVSVKILRNVASGEIVARGRVSASLKTKLKMV